MPHRHLDHLKQTALAYAVLYFNGRMPTSPGSKKATRTLKDDEAIAWLLEYYAKREDYYGQKENTATDYREKTRYGRRKEASKKIVEKLGYIATKYKLAGKDSQKWANGTIYSPLPRREGEKEVEYAERLQKSLEERNVDEIEGRVDYLNMQLLLTEEILVLSRDSQINPLLKEREVMERKNWIQGRLRSLEIELDEAI